jgi:hypothetical protein
MFIVPKNFTCFEMGPHLQRLEKCDYYWPLTESLPFLRFQSAPHRDTESAMGTSCNGNGIHCRNHMTSGGRGVKVNIYRLHRERKRGEDPWGDRVILGKRTASVSLTRNI